MPRPIGWEIPSTYWCYGCVPEGVDSSDPLTEDDAHGVPFTCEGCGADMTPEKWEADES